MCCVLFSPLLDRLSPGDPSCDAVAAGLSHLACVMTGKTTLDRCGGHKVKATALSYHCVTLKCNVCDSDRGKTSLMLRVDCFVI